MPFKVIFAIMSAILVFSSQYLQSGFYFFGYSLKFWVSDRPKIWNESVEVMNLQTVKVRYGLIGVKTDYFATRMKTKKEWIWGVFPELIMTKHWKLCGGNCPRQGIFRGFVKLSNLREKNIRKYVLLHTVSCLDSNKTKIFCRFSLFSKSGLYRLDTIFFLISCKHYVNIFARLNIMVGLMLMGLLLSLFKIV